MSSDNDLFHDHVVVRDAEGILFVSFRIKKLMDDALLDSIDLALERFVSQHRKRKFLINFSSLKKASALFVSTLVALQEHLYSVGGTLVLCSICPGILHVFETAERSKSFFIEQDTEAALKRLASL